MANPTDDKPKTKIYFSFPSSLLETAKALKADFENKHFNEFEVLPFEASQEFQSEKNNIRDIHGYLQEASVFILFVDKQTFDVQQIDYEMRAAIWHKQRRQEPTSLIAILVGSPEVDEFVPSEFNEFSTIDYRDIEGRTAAFVELYTKIKEELGRKITKKESDQLRSFVFGEVMTPNPRLAAFKRIFRQEFEVAFKEHVGDRLKELTDLRRAQDKLMTPEIIQIAEAQAFDEIWVVSHTLNTDLHNKDVANSIRDNINGKGIQYTYFVPDTELARRAIAKYHEKFSVPLKRQAKSSANVVSLDEVLKGENVSVGTGGYKFRFLEAGVFMPFDELVIYDGENPSSSWGYIQMSYENSGETPLTLKVPQRTLNLVTNFLKSHKELQVEC